MIRRIEDDDSNSSEDDKPPSKKFNHINTNFDSNIFKKSNKDASTGESSETKMGLSHSQPAKPNRCGAEIRNQSQ